MIAGAVLGALLGSFAGVILDRVPARESVVHGPSRCRTCGRRLNALDLVPVAGYLVRRGRCASCRAPIPARWPLLEAASGACVALSIAALGPWPGIGAGVLTLVAGTLIGLWLEVGWTDGRVHR